MFINKREVILTLVLLNVMLFMHVLLNDGMKLLEATAIGSHNKNDVIYDVTESTSEFRGRDNGVVTILKPEIQKFRSWDNGIVTVLKPEIQKNCTKILLGDQNEIKKVRAMNARWKNSLSDEQLFEMTRNCSWVKDYFKDNLYITKLERSFPIAFSFVVHESPQQVLRLLKFLYRPQNQYCIHPDVKSNRVFTSIFSNISQCLDNVHIASKREDVLWGEYTLMEAQMNCMSDLVELRRRQSNEKKWKYLINLCGKELPLSTNHEIVSHLSKLNGSSALSIVPYKRQALERLRHKSIPFKLRLYKSWTFMGISYDFAHFLLTNTTVIAVHNFFKGCHIPEEHFYSVMYMIPGVPGGYNPNIPSETYVNISQIFWTHINKAYDCVGVIMHSICIVTVNDLKVIVKCSKDGRSAMFHNKYFMEQDHTIMDCMEERLVARNKKEYERDTTL